jgi:hypothetical protein
MRKRPKMPSGLRLKIHERDGYACRECGWVAPKPSGYRGHGRVGVVVGTRRKLVYFKGFFNDKDDIRIYADVDVWRYLEVDHIVPLDAGGPFGDPDNLQTLCSPCNNRKGARV